jgi:anti-sigma B factor antagonist
MGSALLSVRTVSSSGFANVVLAGELDLSSLPMLAERLSDVDGHDDVILDLSELTFMDSVGLGALIRARLDADQRGIRFTIRGLHSSVRRLLEITDLTAWFGVEAHVPTLLIGPETRLGA